VNPRAAISTAVRRRYLRAPLLALAVLATPCLSGGARAADVSEALRPILAPVAAPEKAQPFSRYRQWSALQIMREEQRRHEQFPYVYEEQTMVLTDAQGHKSVRKLRRFSRIEEDGSTKFLLIFDDPEEIRGVTLLAKRDAHGDTEQGVYLPAWGAEFKEPAADTRSGHFLGTDFSVDDLTTETLEKHSYVRGRDQLRESTEFFMIDAYPIDAKVERNSGYALRRHLVRKDLFMIVRTDFFDRELHFMKRITRHDLQRVSGESWRANMIVVSDERDKHHTLLKINRRIYSRDYVPAEIFNREFLVRNSRFGSLSDRVPGRRSRTPALPGADKSGKDDAGPAKSNSNAIIDRPTIARSAAQ